MKAAEIVKAVEVAAGAAVGAYTSTYFGGSEGYKIADKVPVEPLAALVLWGVGAFALKPKTGEHLCNLGDGVMAGWIAKEAADMALSQKVSGASSKGYPESYQYQLGAGPAAYDPSYVNPLLRAAGLG